ncbi:MAG: hypothetical protein HYX24_06500 [Candidatus Aenigmarchaeota archaeon]|nr:hypothetical protein [Candidatus Aenigmarchaeota archaeon]
MAYNTDDVANEIEKMCLNLAGKLRGIVDDLKSYPPEVLQNYVKGNVHYFKQFREIDQILQGTNLHEREEYISSALRELKEERK